MIKLKILYADEFLYNIEREKPPKPRLFENSQILDMSNARTRASGSEMSTVQFRIGFGPDFDLF